MNAAAPHKASVQGALEFRGRLPLWLAGCAVAAAFAAAVTGCSSSAPRFRGEAEGATAVTGVPERARRYAGETPAGIDRDRFLLDVVWYLGVPYEYGGTSRKGIDCSGFTMRVYESAQGTKLPRSTADQFRSGRKVEPDSLMFGDLLFFNTTGVTPSHVGIFIEDGIFAHASVVNGVTLSSIEDRYYRERYVGARRVARARPKER